jgi:hypothetical protein
VLRSFEDGMRERFFGFVGWGMRRSVYRERRCCAR